MATFLEIGKPYTEYKSAKFVVVPVPYEQTVSYGKGTSKGPDAILKASAFVEDYDIEQDSEPYRAGIHVARPIKAVKAIKSRVEEILNDKKVPVLLGGEHSITPFAVAACREKYGNLSVLQFDAHADLKDKYRGSKLSHACVMRRILEICPAVQVGIRSMNMSEARFARESGQISKIHLAEKLELAETVVSQLSKNVYLTFDVDALDPGIMPSTGTPEPGGLDYYSVLDVFKAVAREKNIVGFDFVELAPIKGLHHPDFTTA
ncbi:MAG: agmatinase, partial [bacterium]